MASPPRRAIRRIGPRVSPAPRRGWRVAVGHSRRCRCEGASRASQDGTGPEVHSLGTGRASSFHRSTAKRIPNPDWFLILIGVATKVFA
jgi:hypothetical protein